MAENEIVTKREYLHKYEKGIKFLNEMSNQRIFSDPLHTFYLLTTCLENYCNANIKHRSYTFSSEKLTLLMYEVKYRDNLISMQVNDNDKIQLIKKSLDNECEATLSEVIELFSEIPETIFVNALLQEVPITPLQKVEKRYDTIKIRFLTSEIVVPENRLAKYSEIYLDLIENDRKVINIPVQCNQSLANKIRETICSGEIDHIHNAMTKSYQNLEIVIDIFNYLGIHVGQ